MAFRSRMMMAPFREIQLLTCEDCGDLFDNKDTFAAHATIVHPDKKTPEVALRIEREMFDTNYDPRVEYAILEQERENFAREHCEDCDSDED